MKMECSIHILQTPSTDTPLGPYVVCTCRYGLVYYYRSCVDDVEAESLADEIDGFVIEV